MTPPPTDPDTLNRDALAMTAGEQQQQIGETKPVWAHGGQARRQGMRLQMVDRQPDSFSDILVRGSCRRRGAANRQEPVAPIHHVEKHGARVDFPYIDRQQ